MGNILPWSTAALCQRAIARNDADRHRRVQQTRDALAACGQSQARREHIHAMPLLQLRDKLQAGDLTATEVLCTYVHFALLAHDRLNCVAEFLPEAFEAARKLDAEYAGGDKKKPPLFGLPFSVKANFYLKDYDCCIGLARWLGQPQDADCTFVTLLRRLGAVPFCYTNVPQTLMSFVCSNPVYGTTGNPHDAKRTPGGSSGGDAALLAAGGCTFATGGDIGGSLRIPAQFCGVTTLKPGQHRFQIANAHTGLPGHGRLGLGTGVFTKSVEELVWLLSHLIGNQDYHDQLMPASAPLPLDMNKLDELGKRARSGKMRIGYHANDGFLKPIPACARVVEETVEKLRAAGHEMVLFQIPEPDKAASLLFKMLVSDGGAYYCKLLSENTVDVYMKKQAMMLKLPFWLRRMAACVLDWLSPQLALIARAAVRTPAEVREAQAELDDYARKFSALWLEHGLDALLVPAFPVCAVPHQWPSDLVACAFATGLFNMLDLPAGVVPTGTVSKADDAALMDDKQWAVDGNLLLKWMRTAAANSAGMPVGVQVVTQRWEEERCLAVMGAVEEAAKGHI